MPKPFLEHGDPQSCNIMPQSLSVTVRFDPLLTRVIRVDTCNRLEQHRVVRDVCSHWADMVDKHLERHHARIRHQAVRGFHAAHTAERRGNANGAALIAADGHVHVAGSYQGSASRRGATRRVTMLERVVHRASRVGVAAAGQTEELAVCLARDLAARVQNALHHRRVDFRHVAFQGGGAAHHRHTGEHDVVLERHGLSRERSSIRALNAGTVVPSVQWIVSRARPRPGVPRVTHRRQFVVHRLNQIDRVDRRPHQVPKRFNIVFG